MTFFNKAECRRAENMGKTLKKGGDKEGKQGKIWDNLGGNVTHLSTSEDNVSLQHHPYPLRQE